MGRIIDTFLDWLDKKGGPVRARLAAEPWRVRNIRGRRFITRSGVNKKIAID